MGLLGQKRADILKFPILCKFSSIGLLGQKRRHIFKFAIFLPKHFAKKGAQL